MQVLYVGFFHDGPVSGCGDVASEAEAFTSCLEARHKLVERVTGSGRCETAYPVCHDDMVATHVREERTELMPASEDAYIDLYAVVPNEYKGWGYVAGDPECRVSMDSHGRARCEEF